MTETYGTANSKFYAEIHEYWLPGGRVIKVTFVRRWSARSKEWVQEFKTLGAARQAVRVFRAQRKA